MLFRASAHDTCGKNRCLPCTQQMQAVAALATELSRPGDADQKHIRCGRGPAADSKAGSIVRGSPPWPSSWPPSLHCVTRCCCTCAASRTLTQCRLQWVWHSWCSLGSKVGIPGGDSYGAVQKPCPGLDAWDHTGAHCSAPLHSPGRTRTQTEAPAVLHAQLPCGTVCIEAPAVQPLTMAHVGPQGGPQGGPRCAACMCLFVQPLTMAHACPQ